MSKRKTRHGAGHLQRRTPKRFGACAYLADSWYDDADNLYDQVAETDFLEQQQADDCEELRVDEKEAGSHRVGQYPENASG